MQQHMANLKRQRALEAERAKMAKEDALALALVREERRFVRAYARVFHFVFVAIGRAIRLKFMV